MSAFDISEPGFWVWAGLLFIVGSELAASLYLRPKRRELIRRVDAILARGDANGGDRAWLTTALDTASDRSFPWVVALVAPLLAIGFVLVTWRDYLRETDTQREQQWDEESDRIHTELIRMTTGRTPDDGAYWHSDDRVKIEDLAHDIQTFVSPIPAIWVALWMAVAMLFILPAFLIGSPARPAIIAFLEQIASAYTFERLRFALKVLA